VESRCSTILFSTDLPSVMPWAAVNNYASEKSTAQGHDLAMDGRSAFDIRIAFGVICTPYEDQDKSKSVKPDQLRGQAWACNTCIYLSRSFLTLGSEQHTFTDLPPRTFSSIAKLLLTLPADLPFVFVE
jgi:hypothetical protein